MGRGHAVLAPAADEARHVLRRFDRGTAAAWPVDAAVETVRTEGPGCVAPIAA